MNKRVRSLHVVMFIASLMLSGWLSAADLQLQPRIQVHAPRTVLSDDVQAWLKAHPVIHVGVWGASHPPVGEGMSYGLYQGIAADYLAMLENSLQLKFVLHYYQTSDDALDALSRHEIDMLSIWNPVRWPSQAARATTPWLLDKSVLITQNSDTSAASPGAGFTLGVVADDFDPALFLRHYPTSTLRHLSQFDQAINEVFYGQTDALWLNRATAEYLMRYQHISGLKTTPSAVFPNLNLSFGIDRQLPELLTAIDATLQQLPLVSRMRIAIGWGLNREAVITRNPLGLTQQEERWLHNHKRIPVILDSHRPPVSAVVRGSPAGLVVDMLDTLTRRYGLNFDLLMTDDRMTAERLQQAHPEALLANNWFMAWPDQSKNNLALRSTLITSPMVVAMQQSVTVPDALDSLKGERLAINRDNPVVPWLQTWYPSIELTLTDNLYQAAELLRSNSVRGFIAPQLVARYLINAGDSDAWHIAISLPLPSSHLAITASDSSSIPLQIVGKALADVPPENVIELTTPWQQPATSLVPGVSDRLLGLTLIWGSIVAITLLVSAIWIRRLYNALQRGRRAQDALSDQYNFTRALIDNAPIALYARDLEGRLLDYNQRWSDTVRIDGSELKGSRITDVVSMESETTQKLAAQYRLVLEKGETQKWDGPFLFNNELHHLQGWTVPWRDSRGNIGGLIGGWLDMTEKEALITHLQLVKADLEQAHASKAAFMQSMGHEVRTPLNAIIGLLDIELQNSQNSQYPNENLPLIWESAGNLLSIIGDVFDIFRADNLALRGMARSVHLQQLIEGTVALYRQQLEDKALILEIETALNTQRFDTDPLLIIRIFSSLLRNAIKHGKGSVISVALYQGRQDEDGSVPLVIEVTNEGVISADIDALSPHNAENTGWQETGISLNACQIMASANGAELSIENDADEGTTVSLYFNAKPSEENRPLQHQQHVHRVLNIMIVDDYAPGRRALQQQLEGWGHKTVQADDGEQAMHLWQQQLKTIDVIITDCTMPVIDGFSLARLIREHEEQHQLAAIPIFGLTAMTGFEIASRCLAAGMNECLIKPLSPAALQTVLQRYFPELELPAPASSPAHDTELLREMAEINEQDAEKLRATLLNGDLLSVGRLAHRLRGAATMLKHDALYDACRALETACQQETSLTLIQELADDVFKTLDEANGNIQLKIQSGYGHK